MKSNIVFNVNSNRYVLYKNHSVISVLPDFLEKTLNGIRVDDDYYMRKKVWLEKYGFFNEDSHLIFTEFMSSDIEFYIKNLEQIVFEITDLCNMKCKYCGYRDMYNDYDSRTGSNMDFRTAKITLDYLFDRWRSIRLNRNVYVSFYGGEPLINMSLVKKIVKYVKENAPANIKYIFGITTNAVLLNKYMDYLVDNEFVVLISLDGNRYNNSYRVYDEDGKRESFDSVYCNISKIKDKYPDYFRSNVSINSVLHDRNSAYDILNFVYREFDKIPRIGELNPNGINPEYKTEYEKMKKNTQKSLDEMPESEIKNKFFMNIPNNRLLFEFISNYSGNMFSSYNALFVSKKYHIRKYSGTCVPFEKKMFVTVNGKILPCTSISQEYAIGNVSDFDVDINYDCLEKKYNTWIDTIKNKCNLCCNQETCKMCLFNMKKKGDGFVCEEFIPESKFHHLLSYIYNLLQANTDSYLRIMTKSIIQ